MNYDDLDQMIIEIDNFIADLKSERKTIDPEARNIRYTTKNYSGGKESAGTLSDNLAHSISTYKEYKNSDHPLRAHYIIECYEWIMKAITGDVIKGNNVMQELEQSKQLCKKLENDIKDKNSIIDELREIKIKQDERIRIHEKMYPDLKRLGDSEESELTENE